MKLIVAGTRTIDDYRLVEEAIEVGWIARHGWPSQIISGTRPTEEEELTLTRFPDSRKVKGVDKLAAFWGWCNSVPVLFFDADWNRYGRAAGPIRNREMARHGDGLLAIWDGRSRGTRNMIEEANARDLRVEVWRSVPTNVPTPAYNQPTNRESGPS